MSEKNYVIRHSSHVKEDQSKRAFEEIIEPWYASWSQKDYGIDAIVELTTPLKRSQDIKTDGKFFFVQLKATSKLKVTDSKICFSVPTRKVHQWLNSNLMFMLVIFDVTTCNFYYLWIDDDVKINLEKGNPTWTLKNTVTLKFPVTNRIDSSFHEKVRQVVLTQKKLLPYILAPGQFFEFQSQCQSQLIQLKTISSQYDFNSVRGLIDDCQKELDVSIYQVAFTGMSRVGKSSLVNSVLKRKLSPTGFFQTTVVPIKFLPGKEEAIEICYSNGIKERFKLSENVIAQFGSQASNLNNVKGVDLISISLLNSELQKGISFLDIPGLDDPNDTITAFTLNALSRANAIFYVIDSSPAQNGGFIFRKDYKNDILSLGQNLDKFFLVFSKADTVSEHNLLLLKERVNADLKNLDLYDKISDKIYYISTLDVSCRPDLDSISKLEEDLWRYIINENKYGLTRLSKISHGLSNTAQQLVEILNIRLLNAGKRIELQNAIDAVKLRVPTISKQSQQLISDLEKKTFTSLTLQKNEILHSLEKWLFAVELNKSLPDSKAIKKFLLTELNNVVSVSNSEYSNGLHHIKSVIDDWIEINLRIIRNMLSNSSTKQRILDISEIENYEEPKVDLGSAFGMGMLGYITGFIINPGVAISAAIVGFFGNLLVSAESRRAKQMQKIMVESRKRYDKSFESLAALYNEVITEHSFILNNYFGKNLNNYFDDLTLQMENIQENFSEDELNRHKDSILKISEYISHTASFRKSLSSYTNHV